MLRGLSGNNARQTFDLKIQQVPGPDKN